MKIITIAGREIYDSRGEPTLECEILLEDGKRIIASVPSGASRGEHEAVEMRDGGDRLMGKGLLKAIAVIENKIAPLLIGHEPQVVEFDLRMIELDGTREKSVLGGNVMLAVSSALLKAQAYVEEVEVYELIAHLSGFESVIMPFPLFNMINGGLHADNNLRIQEFMVIPIGEHSFRASMQAGAVFFHTLKDVLHKAGKQTCVGDEGGFAPHFDDETQALDLLSETAQLVETRHGGNYVLALDVAASQFYNPITRLYNWRGKPCTSDELIEFYDQLTRQYPIYSLEDGLSENDWDGWFALNAKLGDRLQIVGDDLFVTSIERILYGLQKDAANSVIIKPNQCGTITQTLQAIKLCKEHDLSVIVSHRSGDTSDTLIADIAVGSNAGQIKAGGFSRSERMAKYNRLLRIEDRLTGDLLLA